jgi:hypothetical protein
MAYRADDKGPYGAALRAASGDRQKAQAIYTLWRDSGAITTNRDGVPVVQDGQSLPWVNISSMDSQQLSALSRNGRHALGAETETRTAAARSESQRELSRFEIMGPPVWSFREASAASIAAQKARDEQLARDYWDARMRDAPRMSAYDPKAVAAADAQRRQETNSIGLWAGGVFGLPGFAARGLGAPESVVEAVTDTTVTVGMVGVAGGFRARIIEPQPRTYADFFKWNPNKTADPGVPQLVDAIESRFPGLVRQVEIPIHDVPPLEWKGPPPNITDLDIVLIDGRVIQVKEGSGGKIIKQLGVSKEITGVDPIGFDANKLIYGDAAQGFKPGTVREAARQGYKIVNTVDELLGHLESIYGPR